MILTCPDCSTRYSVKDDAVGPNGRTVRCSTCETTWFVSADADAMAHQENVRDEIPDVPESSMDFDQGAAAVAADPTPVMGAHVQIRDKAERERRNRRLMGVSMVWVVTIGILLTALILGFVFRHGIVDRSPAAASVYKALGMDVKLSGLDFDSPTTRNVLEDGKAVLVVNGNIVNRSGEAQSVPLIRLSLHSNSGEELTHWMVEPPNDVLESKQRMEYVSQYPNPPLDAVSLKYRFADDISGGSGS